MKGTLSPTMHEFYLFIVDSFAKFAQPIPILSKKVCIADALMKYFNCFCTPIFSLQKIKHYFATHIHQISLLKGFTATKRIS